MTAHSQGVAFFRNLPSRTGYAFRNYFLQFWSKPVSFCFEIFGLRHFSYTHPKGVLNNFTFLRYIGVHHWWVGVWQCRNPWEHVPCWWSQQTVVWIFSGLRWRSLTHPTHSISPFFFRPLTHENYPYWDVEMLHFGWTQRTGHPLV